MSSTIKAWIGVIACVAISYCIGSGWIKFGPPRDGDQDRPQARASAIDPAIIRASADENSPTLLEPLAPIQPRDPAKAAAKTDQGPGPNPPSPAELAKSDTNSGSVKNPPAKKAARTKPPTTLCEAASVTYTVGEKKSDLSVDTESLVTDGPTLTMVVTVDPRYIQDKDQYSAQLVKLVPPEYQPPTTTPVVDPNNPKGIFSIQVKEVGTYTLIVTRSPGDGTNEECRRIITINPATQPSTLLAPKLLYIEQSVDGRAVAFTDLTSPVPLLSGTFKVIVSSPEAGRPVLLMNRTTGKPMLNVQGAVVIDKVPSANGPLALPVSVPDATLVDQPADLRAIDAWTLQESNVATVVIESSARPNPGDRPGGGDGLVAGALPPPGPGVRPTGPNVEFPEYTPPRAKPDGFNPSDKVDTRVAQLYYFRDAHRVAQILDRDVKSYNKVAVDTRRRQAEAARTTADQATDNRRFQEIKAVQAAQKTRAAERKLQQAQAKLDAANNSVTQGQPTLNAQLQNVQDKIDANNAAIAAKEKVLQTTTAAPKDRAEYSQLLVEKNTLTQQQTNLQASLASAKASTDPKSIDALTKERDAAQAELQTSRDTETAESDQAVKESQIEDRDREAQFRQEVAAADEDPDTYAPGKPSSADPVRQVSISVIGEGQIQLRGPIKGVNIIRRMINQIDSPVGQVRVGIHTVQINGEHGDRMEKAAGRIQDYIDHSRFLTSQSAQMLRNAVVTVASQKAEAANEQAEAEMNEQLGFCPDDPARQAEIRHHFGSQAYRDGKYIRAFFGEDFIRELEAIDSEFLMSGNKLLSLHSMDTTSLASALFVMALAKNQTRLEILQEFRMMLDNDLPRAEASYFAAGGGARTEGHHKKFKMFANNARFESLMGFFNARVAGDDTISPIQREFIRLAQIFKSRLVVEMEFNERVKERGIIEQRLGDYIEELRVAKNKEEAANQAVAAAQIKKADQQRTVILVASKFSASVNAAIASTELLSTSKTYRAFARQVSSDTFNSVLIASKAESIAAELTRRGRKDLANRVANAVKETKSFIQDNPICDENDLVPLRLVHATRVLNACLKEIVGALPNQEGQAPLKVDDPIFPLIGFFRIGYSVGCPPSVVFYQVTEDGTFSVINRATYETARQTNRPPPSSKDVKLDAATVRAQTLTLAEIKNAVHDTAKNRKLLIPFHFGPTDQAKLDQADRLLAVLTQRPDFLTDIARNDQVFGIEEELAREILYFTELLNAEFDQLKNQVATFATQFSQSEGELISGLSKSQQKTSESYTKWREIRQKIVEYIAFDSPLRREISPYLATMDRAFEGLLTADLQNQFALQFARNSRQKLDHKKLLDMLIDEVEEKYIELLEGTRAHTANVDAYIKAVATALDDDFNTQFYYPSFAEIRKAGRAWDVNLSQIETTTVLANNRGFAKVEPQATMEFDLPKRDIAIVEAMNGAKAIYQDIGALANDPAFLALTKLRSGQPTSSLAPGAGKGVNTVRNALPGLPSQGDEKLMSQQGGGDQKFGAAMEALIPDPAVYKFETGTGFEIRPVLQPDGQSLVFHFNYMYTTNVREPVRADEKHLGRVKRHFIDTDVQLGNYELREVSRYQVALKASRTSRGVPLFEDIPGLGILFHPLPSAESSLQENIVLAQGTIFPTLFDLMGLRWAPAVADLDTLTLRNDEFVVRNRGRALSNYVFDYASQQVDGFLQIPADRQRRDLYRSQATIPDRHPNGYIGNGLDLKDSTLREGYSPTRTTPPSRFIPTNSRNTPQLDAPAETPVDPLPAPDPNSTSPFAPIQGSRYAPSSSATLTKVAGTRPAARTPPRGALPPLPGEVVASKPSAKAATSTTTSNRSAKVQGSKPSVDDSLEKASTPPPKRQSLLSKLRGSDN